MSLIRYEIYSFLDRYWIYDHTERRIYLRNRSSESNSDRYESHISYVLLLEMLLILSILFSKTDTTMDNLTSLAILHSAGFTHKDLKKIFETHENYEEIYESLIHGKTIELPWMTDERKNKILEKLGKINTE
jgi:hypothetical protein